jgi:hypothetical protein
LTWEGWSMGKDREMESSSVMYIYISGKEGTYRKRVQKLSFPCSCHKAMRTRINRTPISAGFSLHVSHHETFRPPCRRQISGRDQCHGGNFSNRGAHSSCTKPTTLIRYRRSFNSEKLGIPLGGESRRLKD